jgi:hypothetical protein
MNNPQFPTARKTGLVVQEVPNEVLVYDLDSNKAHCLNETAAIVWKSCNGKNSISDIARFIETETGNGVTEDFVWLAIDQLNESNLLESKMVPAFAGKSRREVIKKIGLAAVVGLPIVASLAAPRSAMANASCNCAGTMSVPQECAPFGCPVNSCSTDGFCI